MKHAILSIKDIPPIYSDEVPPTRAPSSLEIALDRLKSKGAKVINFWRSGNGWQIKTMVPKVNQ